MSSAAPRILDATRDLIAERGAGISMADVAAAAGVSRQAVYMHFASRAGLFVALVRRMDEEADIRRRCERALAASDPIEALRAFIATWLRYAEKIQPVATMLLAARATDPDAAAAWEDRMRELRAGFRYAIDRLDTEGRLRPALTAEAAADLAWAMTSIPVHEQLTVQRGWASRRVRRELVAATVAAVATEGSNRTSPP